MSEGHADFDGDQAVIRQRFMLPLILIGMVCVPVFSFVDWWNGSLLGMTGGIILTVMLAVALVLMLADKAVDFAARLCLTGLLLNWAVLAPFGGAKLDHLLFIWWPIFPLIVFHLIPGKDESLRWFALYVVLLIAEGLLFEGNGRMGDASLAYWSSLLVVFFTAFVVSRWLNLTAHYRQRLRAGERELKEQVELQEIMSHQLAQARKLEEIGLMAGGIAHDFNNLLAIIVGHTELLHDLCVHEKEEAAESLKAISLTATRGAHLARELLAFAGKAQFDNGPVRLDHIAQDMTTLQRIHMPKQIEMELNIRPVPALTGDSAPFEQIVLNLVRNAIDAMAERVGKIAVCTNVIELSADEAEKLDLFAGQTPGRYICLQVQDQGCGIREEDRRQIFDPFYTTKKGGSGLGLASLKNTVRRYQGGLGLESEQGSGTTFTLYFPVPVIEAGGNAALSGASGLAGAFETTGS